MDLQEKMKQEALSRMTSLELYAGAISLFKNSGVVTVSYQGSLTELSEAQAKKVCEFEKETGFLVYHAIRTDTGIGILLTLLYVSNALDEWKAECEGLDEGYPNSYVVNMDDDICSEFGLVGIRKRAGYLVRTE